jgi:hypothetical protein
MDRTTLRRIGWVSASLGITTALVGCNDVKSTTDVSEGSTAAAPTTSYLASSNGLADMNGLNGANGINGHNGLNSANGFWGINGFNGANGLGSVNGFNGANGWKSNNGFGSANGWKAHNGLNSANGINSANGVDESNGFNSANGFNGANGLGSVNGLNIANGLNSANGLGSANGFMTNEHGRMIVQYLARCALPSSQKLIKQDQYGTNFTFPGGIGLVPDYYTQGCGPDCAQALSACMMAHINTSGTHIPLWMVSPDTNVGWATSPAFPTREGTFFGQIMVADANNNIDGYFCNGPGADQNVVPGRIGVNQGEVPYANAWPKSAGMDGLCDTNHSTGTCTAHTYNTSTKVFGCAIGSSNCVIDGPQSCTLNNVVYDHPVTVWRGATYQAENGQGGAWVNGTAPCTAGTSGCAWATSGLNFKTACNPGDSGCAIIADANNGMGKRVGYLTGGSKGIKFSNLTVANAGTNNLIVYYTNGDLPNKTRYLSFVVNGGAPQVRPFGGLYDWTHPRGAAISLAGFTSGGSNTVYVTADPTDPAPDLDWIEVVDSGSSVPSTGLCEPALWKVTASVNSSTASEIVDGDGAQRWTTGSSSVNGQYVQIDFTGNVNLSTITLDNSKVGSGDYPSTFAVYSSTDGSTFSSTPFATAPGAAGKTIISFTQESVRAIRIKATANTPSNGWWSIGEVTTDCDLSK